MQGQLVRLKLILVAALRRRLTRQTPVRHMPQRVHAAINRLRLGAGTEHRYQQNQLGFHGRSKLAGAGNSVGALASALEIGSALSGRRPGAASRDRWRHSLPASLLLVAVATSLSGCSEQPATFAGIWKTDCADYWGVQIVPADGGLYAVTFCGVSGCLPPGDWTPNTRIEGDPMYQIVSATTIRIRRTDSGYFTYFRCRTDPVWQMKSSA